MPQSVAHVLPVIAVVHLPSVHRSVDLRPGFHVVPEASYRSCEIGIGKEVQRLNRNDDVVGAAEKQLPLVRHRIDHREMIGYVRHPPLSRRHVVRRNVHAVAIEAKLIEELQRRALAATEIQQALVISPVDTVVEFEYSSIEAENETFDVR